MKDKAKNIAKQIKSKIEDKVDVLNSKFDKLIEAMAAEHNNYELKEILGFIENQTAAVNEAVANGQIAEIKEKLASFDSNINKIVSYIEED